MAKIFLQTLNKKQKIAASRVFERREAWSCREVVVRKHLSLEE
jgi:hypothetical protein